MYLVSLYFDELSCRKLQKIIDKAASKSGNDFMIKGKVPPHITISAFHCQREEAVIEALNNKCEELKSGVITWASIGVFKSSVLFLAPVLNEYLHNISSQINEEISNVEDVSISKFYKTFQWMPHTTVAKTLNKEQLMLAFEEVEKEFSIFSGSITKIGLSKTNPYEEIKLWELK